MDLKIKIIGKGKDIDNFINIIDNTYNQNYEETHFPAYIDNYDVLYKNHKVYNNVNENGMKKLFYNPDTVDYVNIIEGEIDSITLGMTDEINNIERIIETNDKTITSLEKCSNDLKIELIGQDFESSGEEYYYYENCKCLFKNIIQIDYDEEDIEINSNLYNELKDKEVHTYLNDYIENKIKEIKNGYINNNNHIEYEDTLFYKDFIILNK